MKELEIMIKIASDKQIRTDIGGISYSSWIRSYSNLLKKQRKNSKTNSKCDSKRNSKRNSKRDSKRGSKTNSKRGSKTIQI